MKPRHYEDHWPYLQGGGSGKSAPAAPKSGEGPLFMKKPKFEPGAKVRLTGDFLRSTGQVVGGEGHSRWTVVACECGLCKSGSFVAVNETTDGDAITWRHFNVGNLEKAR